MIGYFPEPYPDEILYSLCARYSEKMKYPVKEGVIRDLLGTRDTVAVVGLPNHLEHLASVLPEPAYTADHLIDNHTLLPFFQPFLSAERLHKLREEMKTSGETGMRQGLTIMNRDMPSRLQYCPLCVEEEKAQFGECYWHRLHQAPGVKVCPIHQVWLESSDVLLLGRGSREFISANQAVHPLPPRRLNLADPCHVALLNIAQDVVWLLSQKNLTPDPEVIRKKCLSLLIERKWATYAEVVRIPLFKEAFKQHYPPDLLRLLNCEIDGITFNWLTRFLRFTTSFQSPLRYLLVFRFLGYTAEAFFNLSVQNSPFGEGPWPCLNPLNDHYRQAVISDCQIKLSRTKGPVGTFSCLCGFVYCRIGPDRTEEDRFRFDEIKLFGPVWESKLKELWNDPAVSSNEICRQLKVSITIVIKHAARLGLSSPRPRYAPQLNEEILNAYRAEWLTAIQENPSAGITLLMRKFARVHHWLSHYDHKWLTEHTPPSKRPNCPPRTIDWQSRDIQLAEAVKNAVQRIKGKPGSPEQVTIAAIIKEVGFQKTFRSYLHQLPLTSQILTEELETYEDFSIRRIQWAVEYFRQRHHCPNEQQLIRRAGVYRTEPPRIREALDLALQQLSQLPSKKRQLISPLSLEECREAWVAAQKEAPYVGLNQLNNRLYRIYRRLKKYDPEWLKANTPPVNQYRRKPKALPSPVNWELQDAHVLEVVQLAVTKIKDDPEFPTRLTATTIGRETGYFYWLSSQLDKLPRTAKFLAEVIETHEMFGVRRVWWAAERFREEGIYPARTKLITRARVAFLIKRPEVSQAIEAALQSLSNLGAV